MKKKVVLIVSCLMVSLFFISYTFAYDSINSTNNGTILYDSEEEYVNISGEFEADLVARAFFDTDQSGLYNEGTRHYWTRNTPGPPDMYNVYFTTDGLFEHEYTFDGPISLKVEVRQVSGNTTLQRVTYAQTKMMW